MAKVEIKTSSNNKKYIAIESDTFKASVFPIANAKEGKGSTLAFNLSLVLLKGNVAINADVRRISKGEAAGQLVIGSSSHKLDGHRAIVTDFLKELDDNGNAVLDDKGNVKGKVIERASIPMGEYTRLMDAIAEGDKLLTAEA